MPFSEKLKNYVKKIIIPRNMLQNISMLHVLPLPGMKQRIVSLLTKKTDDSC